MCMGGVVYVSVSVCRFLGLKKPKATVLWELPFQVGVSHPMWGMGIDFRFSSRAAHTQNYRAPSPLLLPGTPVFKCYFLAHEDGYEAVSMRCGECVKVRLATRLYSQGRKGRSTLQIITVMIGQLERAAK